MKFWGLYTCHDRRYWLSNSQMFPYDYTPSRRYQILVPPYTLNLLFLLDGDVSLVETPLTRL